MAAPDQRIIQYDEDEKEIHLWVHDRDDKGSMTFTNAVKITLEKPEIAPILLVLLGTDIKE